MKIDINKKLKIVLVSILVILIGTSTFLLYRQVNNPKFEDKTVKLYNYSNKSTVNYKVLLKPNILYNEPSLGEGQIYIAEFVDYINTTFNYEFSGDRETEIHGDYNIIANVAGTIKGEEKNDIVVWQKDFRIQPKKSFSVNGNQLEISENIDIRLDEYNEFAKIVSEASKVSSSVNLNVYMSINLRGTTDKGSIEENLSPSLTIPLNTSMFEIGGNTNIDKPGAIEETTQVQIPVDSKELLLYGIIIAILTLALILVILFIKTAPNKDPHERLLKRIFKNHGDRLVALNSELTINNAKTSYVNSIDDLVKIADEVGKPIFYKCSQDYREITKFYVADEDQVYLLDLSHMLVKDEEEVKIES